MHSQSAKMPVQLCAFAAFEPGLGKTVIPTAPLQKCQCRGLMRIERCRKIQKVLEQFKSHQKPVSVS